jgi:hypothetical protein|uniref:Uncharacterized protein n=1 Tax=viral metagenome TaxID=1070528 RepID=A0A6C0BY94_9ZZZZ
MKFISLGIGCWVKMLIKLFNKDKKNQLSDIFDWCKTFDFNNFIKALEDKWDILKHEDITIYNGIHNTKYKIYLPHENSSKIEDEKNKYIRRYKRFINYSNNDDVYICFRRITEPDKINIHDYNYDNNDKNSYTKENYDRIIKYLPKNTHIVLLCTSYLDKNINIYDKFIVLDNIINPGLLFHTSSNKENLIYKKKYQNFFNKFKENENRITKSLIISLGEIIKN